MTQHQLWGGRFSGGMDELMAHLNNSMRFDARLWDADIRGSVAYAQALAGAGIITQKEAAALQRGLKAVREEFATGAFETQPSDEDIHTAVERRLKELAGDVAGKLHTGRSRNDQIATDMRLFALDEIAVAQTQIALLQDALLAKAQAHVNTLMPAYTHMQRAQPSTFAHWCLAYFWQFQRDRERLADCARRTSVMPLGSGALAGNPFNIDRAALAKALGFKAVSDNSLDGVSDRDFVAELQFCLAMLGIHISRMAEDLVIYSTAEFGFVTLADTYSTGSSLMPQKKNPDSMELAKGKSARLMGNLMAILTLLKGLPMTYDKDMQEDKEPLFDSLDTIAMTLPVCAAVIATLRVNADRMQAALDPAMLSTDVAEYLVRRGVPFREAHHMAGRAVALAEGKAIPMSELSQDDWRSISPHFGDDIRAVFNFAQSVKSRAVVGGTGEVKGQIKRAQKALAKKG
ncbi:MAG TPA: argininosuccinate lyase [Thermoflexales bacterium]|nr:argininosuccinate lyase [Thermoflexales bacterium]HQZ23522.1 argininosuccinate lyase [Thermoflexales bacterium]HRA00876.1 argininosuccinate lyase [Thermoflexales bacterium]